MVLNRQIVISLVVLTFIAIESLWASPISATDAQIAVERWLESDEAPMGTSLGRQIEWTDTFSDANDLNLYYVVYLRPSGFVIVAADDLVEPIIGFVAGYAYYDPSPENVLGAMVSRDLPSRVGAANKLESKLNHSSRNEHLTQKELTSKTRALRARGKWRKFHTSAATRTTSVPDTMPAMYAAGISDVRVAPLLASTWGQDDVYGVYCYNYYTPSHYYDGCVATAMAQFMRYWQWPTAGIGAQTSRIYVNGNSQNATTRGGDALGGPYNWSQMPLSPNRYTTTTQREAIGALCYDAGVAVHMQYAPGGSGAYMSDAKNALVTTFRYGNAIIAGNGYSNIGANLGDMINPNLDSGNPVILAAWQSPNGAGHAFVADGYGYNSETLYHHLNLGWDGYEDAWYNLPNIDTSYAFNVVASCIYNIYTSGSGEIISGRITNSSGDPFPGAVVTADGTGGPYTATSNSNGIYALVKVLPNTTYTITVSASDCSFESQTVTTGLSADGRFTCGNRGSIDFVTGSPLPLAPAAPLSLDYPAASDTGQYTISWSASANATSYELLRSPDGRSSWSQIYADTDTSYSENADDGSYRYSVRAMNGGGVSDWTVGTINCVVAAIPPAPQPPLSITYPIVTSTGRYTISWSPSSGAASYQLQRSGDGGKTWTQVYSDAGASYAETVTIGAYRYRVKAVNRGGQSDWRMGTGTCSARIPPAAPELITYPEANNTGRYTVSWSAAAGTVVYRLERSTDDGSTWRRIRTTSTTSHAQKVASGSYRYRVTAVNKYGASEPTTGQADCIVCIPPKAPESLSYPTRSSTGTYTVRWSNANRATSYLLQRSNDGGQTWTQIYDAAATAYTETVTPGSYRYRVTAKNSGGDSAYKTRAAVCIVNF